MKCIERCDIAVLRKQDYENVLGQYADDTQNRLIKLLEMPYLFQHCTSRMFEQLYFGFKANLLALKKGDVLFREGSKP